MVNAPEVIWGLYHLMTIAVMGKGSQTMNFNDATEQAYKNGYEKGFKDCLEYLGLLSDYEKFGAVLTSNINGMCEDK